MEVVSRLAKFTANCARNVVASMDASAMRTRVTPWRRQAAPGLARGAPAGVTCRRRKCPNWDRW
jgi:hypothetical protein